MCLALCHLVALHRLVKLGRVWMVAVGADVLPPVRRIGLLRPDLSVHMVKVSAPHWTSPLSVTAIPARRHIPCRLMWMGIHMSGLYIVPIGTVVR